MFLSWLRKKSEPPVRKQGNRRLYAPGACGRT
jgi:hypothetical protein